MSATFKAMPIHAGLCLPLPSGGPCRLHLTGLGEMERQHREVIQWFAGSIR